MKTAAELLEELNALDEHVSVEAKTASDAGNSLLETICAYCNEPGLGGGYILLGVAPEENTPWPTYRVVGVENSDKLQSDLATQCSNAFNISVRPRMTSELLENKTVIKIFVSEVGNHEKPVHFKNQQLPRAAYRRIGSTDQRCTEDDLAVFYQGRNGETYDQQIVSDADLADLDPDAIELYRRLRKEADPEAEELNWDDENLLSALGAARRNDRELKPTVAGVLLFGTSRALRQHFPMMRIDYIRIPGIDWVRDPENRFETIEIRSPLIRSVQRVRAAILDDIPKAFSLPAGETQSKGLPRLPDRVIREITTNAVIHRSYRHHRPIQIIRYTNRIEIRNPGYSLKAEERLGEPGSESRNPKIAAVFHDLHIAETKGSGIRVTRELMKERNLSPPFFKSDRVENSFIATLLFHHFLDHDDMEWLKTFHSHYLNEHEVKGLISAREVGAIDNASYRNLNPSVNSLSATTHLRRLCDIELLQKRGKGSTTYYTLTPRILGLWNAIQNRDTNREPSSQFKHLTNPSPEVDPWTASREEWLRILPVELWSEAHSLPDRATPKALRRVIHRLCLWKDLPLTSLSRILVKSEDHLWRAAIKSMIQEGDLVFTTAPWRKHQKQTYRSKIRSQSDGGRGN